MLIAFQQKHMLQIYALNNKATIEQSINFSGLINLEISQLRHMTFFKNTIITYIKFIHPSDWDQSILIDCDSDVNASTSTMYHYFFSNIYFSFKICLSSTSIS